MNTHNDTPGKAQRYAPPCCDETRPADQRGDYAGKLTELFFAYNLETLPVNYSNCFGCGERTSHNELQKIEDCWCCDDCRLEMQEAN